MRHTRFGLIPILFAVTMMNCYAAKQSGLKADLRPTKIDPESENRGLHNADAPTDVVFDALLRLPEVSGRIDDMDHPDRESLRKLFATVQVDLGRSNEVDYVVFGTFPIGNGDSEWFWIVRTKQQEASVIFYGPGGHWLKLQRQKTNGYRNVEEGTGTPAQPDELLYRYDGSVYRLVKDKLRIVKP